MRAHGFKAAEVDSVVKLGVERLSPGDVEGDLDKFVKGIGGRRVRMIDPYASAGRLLRHIFRRRAGDNTSTSGDIYEIPKEF